MISNMEMEIPVGTLVRLMNQNTEDGWVGKIEVQDEVGVVIDHKVDSEWLSGHGPIDHELSLVSWNDGAVKWIYSDRLTTYGL